MKCTAVAFLNSKSPRPKSVLHGGFRGLKHARMSRNTDVYAPEESTVVEPNYDLSYIDSFPHRRRNWLLLHCTDAIVIPVGSLAELRQILSPLMKEAVQPSTNTAIVIKLFITITKPVMLFESRMVYDCVDSLWSIMAGVGQASLSDYFETCLYSGVEGRLRDCADVANYMHSPATGGHEALQGSTVPGPVFARYVFKTLHHIQAGGLPNKQAILDELVQPICDRLVHEHVRQGCWERFATSVIPLKAIKRHVMEAVGIALKGYNDTAAAYFPYTQPSTGVLNPEQTAVLQVVKASREALRRQLASKLLDLVVVPQSKVVATFLLAYFYECLGLTAVDTNQDEAHFQNPFDSAAQPLQQQATSRHLWRSLKIEEWHAMMYAWGVVKGPTARMTLLSGGHSAIVTDCTKARDAIRVSCQILEHSMQQLHSMCMSIRDAPGVAPSPSANLSSHWQRALVADLKSTMQQTAHGLLDGVVLAARRAVKSVLPQELQQLVMSKLELHRAPADQHWCFRLA